MKIYCGIVRSDNRDENHYIVFKSNFVLTQGKIYRISYDGHLLKSTDLFSLPRVQIIKVIETTIGKYKMPISISPDFPEVKLAYNDIALKEEDIKIGGDATTIHFANGLLTFTDGKDATLFTFTFAESLEDKDKEKSSTVEKEIKKIKNEVKETEIKEEEKACCCCGGNCKKTKQQKSSEVTVTDNDIFFTAVRKFIRGE